ncbi:MAG: Rieske 2Fe-2S domain-containing protein [Gemmatimonadota bacterium]
MSVRYVAVNWNRQKRIYDLTLVLAVLGSMTLFAVVTAVAHPDATIETMLIRGLGFTAFLLLVLILSIGPASRLDRRVLPLLYNRRHLGVTLAILALAHAGFTVVQYHTAGTLNPFVSLLTSSGRYEFSLRFPFEVFGLAALAVIWIMAVTSHDYWLSALSPPVWKRLHMLVYVAFLALLAHVGLGLLQADPNPVLIAVVAASTVLVGALHLAAALHEQPADRAPAGTEPDWVAVCNVHEIVEGRARIGLVGGERVAVFRHGGRLSCVSNVCKHQNGPLGEGRIVDGCITCPWHGYQYRPEDGRSPPPFNDRIATYDLRIAGGTVLVRSKPHAPGTRVEPVAIPEGI